MFRSICLNINLIILLQCNETRFKYMGAALLVFLAYCCIELSSYTERYYQKEVL